MALADPRGASRTCPRGPNSFIFKQFWAKLTLGTPSGKSWLRHCQSARFTKLKDWGFGAIPVKFPILTNSAAVERGWGGRSGCQHRSSTRGLIRRGNGRQSPDVTIWILNSVLPIFKFACSFR